MAQITWMYPQQRPQVPLEHAQEAWNGKTQKKQKFYLDGLTGLRGLAMIAIVLYHLFPQVFPGAWLQVQVFLLISAYFASVKLIGQFSQDTERGPLPYIWHRLARLLPPLLFMLGLLTLFLLPQPGILAEFRNSALSSILGLNNVHQLSQGLSYFDVHGRYNLLKHLWMLSLEMQYSLIWPLLVFLLARSCKKQMGPRQSQIQLRRLIAWTAFGLSLLSALLMLVLYLTGTPVIRLYYGTDTRLFGYLLGALLAALLSKRQLSSLPRILPKNWAPLPYVLFTLLLVPLVLVPAESSFAYCGGILAYTLLTLVFLPFAAGHQGLLGRLFLSAPLQYIGRRAYHIYLWQHALQELFRYYFAYSRAPFILPLLLQLLLLALLAELSYRLFEQPRQCRSLVLLLRRRVFPNKAIERVKVLLCLLLCCTVPLCFVYSFFIPQQDFRKELEQRLQEAQKLQDKQRQEHAQQQAQKTSESPSPQAGQSSASKDANTEVSPTPPAASQASQASVSEATVPANDPGARSFERDWKNLLSQWGQGLGEASKNIPAAVENYPQLALTEAEARAAASMPITVEGDSVFLCGADYWGSLFPLMQYESRVSRQMPDGVQTLKTMAQQGTLQPVVIFALGTNGINDFQGLEELISENRDHLFFLVSVVLPESQVEQAVNAAYNRLQARYDNVRLIDWYGFAKGSSELFYPDATHPSPDGSKIYAQFMAKAIVTAGRPPTN